MGELVGDDELIPKDRDEAHASDDLYAVAVGGEPRDRNEEHGGVVESRTGEDPEGEADKATAAERDEADKRKAQRHSLARVAHRDDNNEIGDSAREHQPGPRLHACEHDQAHGEEECVEEVDTTKAEP